MSLELFIALRYLKAKRKGLFAVVTTSIGVAGVTVGVAAAPFVMGVELADRRGAEVGGEVVLVSPKSIPLRPSVSHILKGRSENRILA